MLICIHVSNSFSRLNEFQDMKSKENADYTSLSRLSSEEDYTINSIGGRSTKFSTPPKLRAYGVSALVILLLISNALSIWWLLMRTSICAGNKSDDMGIETIFGESTYYHSN